MTVYGMTKVFELLTPDVLRAVAVDAVQAHESEVISDSVVANAEGLTFAGNQISDFAPFSDWEETGEFHENLKFQSNSDIEFTSSGDGYRAIAETFPFDDTIAPHAKTLDQSTINDIKQTFIEKINNKL